MKAKYEISCDIDDIYEKRKLMDLIRGDDYKYVLDKLDSHLRNICKYGGITNEEILKDMLFDEKNNTIQYTNEDIEKIRNGYIVACSQIRSQIFQLLESVSLNLEET